MEPSSAQTEDFRQGQFYLWLEDALGAQVNPPPFLPHPPNLAFIFALLIWKIAYKVADFFTALSHLSHLAVLAHCPDSTTTPTLAWLPLAGSLPSHKRASHLPSCHMHSITFSLPVLQVFGVAIRGGYVTKFQLTGHMHGLSGNNLLPFPFPVSNLFSPCFGPT